MLALDSLKYLAAQKIRDAEYLLRGNRHKAAIYLMGYALELALKRRICLTLGFRAFPQTSAQFRTVVAAIPTGGLSIAVPSSIGDIRHHRLADLLFWSGKEGNVTTSYHKEWLTVLVWTPESRYQQERVGHQKAADFIKSAKTIIIHELF